MVLLQKLSVCRKTIKSNQSKTGHRHLDLAEANLQQRGFYSCSWDNIGKIVWLQLFPKPNISCVSNLTPIPGVTSWQQQRLWPRYVEANDLLQGHPLTTWPGSTLPLFIFVCKAGHPESVTVFFSQAQSNSSPVVLSTNPIAGVMLSSPCNYTFSNWRKAPD